MSGKLSRRELVALLGAGAALGAARPGARGRVGVARVPAGLRLDAAAARRAVAGAIAAAAGARDAVAALRRLAGPEDVVGIKVNCLAGPRLSPRVQLVAALAELLAEAGVPPARIVVFERSSRELRRARYPVGRGGGPFRCVGIDGDYDRRIRTSGAIGSLYARVVTEVATVLISFGVVKDHDLAGVSAGLKNWYGVIHNPNKYHDDNCDPYVADVVRHPVIRDKLRLTILDGGTAQCDGGPAYRPGATWRLGLVAASLDPVAADAWAWRVIEAERRRRGLPTLAEAKRPPRWLATASRYGLGEGDPARIREVRA